MKSKLFMSVILNLMVLTGFSQQVTQTIRGIVTDSNSELPLTGATVVLLNLNPLVGTTSDANGAFRLDNILVGRHSLQISFVGYKTVTIPSLDLVSGKELVLNVALEENLIEAGEIIVKANARKDKPVNDMAFVSARSFTIEETERYAGSWGDPARMSMNYAGVMIGNDQLNAIVIRGNSPGGLLWKLDGVPVPNPNHFGGMGSTSGPVSMLNNNTLNNSDFFTGAFPAQYGNASSGVFDLGIRTGNNQNREYLAQVGFNGFELGTEGPFSKKAGSSYMANYRYSTLAFIDAIGFDMGIGAVPFYQDISFKFDVPVKRAGRFSIFGLGGRNHITFDDPADEYGTRDFTNVASDVGVAGLNHQLRLNDNIRLKTTIAGTYQKNMTISSIYRDEILDEWYGEDTRESKLFIAEELRYKLNPRNNIIAGASIEKISMRYLDSIYLAESNMFVNHLNFSGKMALFQGYLQLQHKFTDMFSLVSGLHYQQTSINSELVLEPRASVQWQLSPSHSFSAGYGMHSQMQPRDIYFREVLVDTLNGIYFQSNKKLDLMKSHHFVLGYNLLINDHLRIKAETYYQYLYDIPVKQYPSSIALINKEAGYYNMNLDSLVNRGTGYNTGIEITFERFLTGNYYYLFTISLFDSKYRASDNIIRNTAYNGNYVFNILGGYEFKFSSQRRLSFDLKFTWAGGMRTIPIDPASSQAAGETTYYYEQAFEARTPDYYRADLRISYKTNHKKFSQELALDIINLTNHRNRFFEMYNKDTGEVEEIGQSGMIPMILWRVRF